ncbi:MAG: redoxin domain-containing protein, partial [Deltaproteobacteria bacterium]
MKLLRASILFLSLTLYPLYSHSAGIGEAPLAFSLKDMKGNTVTLDSMKGKVVFLDFWATWCDPC